MGEQKTGKRQLLKYILLSPTQATKEPYKHPLSFACEASAHSPKMSFAFFCKLNFNSYLGH